MKDNKAIYFPHDTNASTDPKIIGLRVVYGWEAVGMYWAIIEALHKEPTGEIPSNLISLMIIDFYNQEEIRLQVHKTEIAKEMEEYLYANALLVQCNGITTSNRVLENLKNIKEKSIKAQESANKRWHKSTNIKEINNNNANAMRTQCERNAIKINKNKINNNIFNIPSLEEVKKYCEERKNNIDANNFINFYSSKGWFIGKNKMKDWKAAIRTWEVRAIDNKNNAENGIKILHDGTRAILKFGQWVDEKDNSVKIDPHYYPEITK